MLDGYSPWVTGAIHADMIVTGAVLDDGRQILVALPTDLPGVTIPPPPRLVGLSASHTGEVRCDERVACREWLLAGPAENVMQDRRRRGHRRAANLDPGDRAGLGGARLSWSTRRISGPTWPARPPNCGASTRDWRPTLLALAAASAACSNERTARAGQQPRAAHDAGRAGRRQGDRLRRRPSGRPLVPRGAVLPGLELPAGRHGRESVRAGGD